MRGVEGTEEDMEGVGRMTREGGREEGGRREQELRGGEGREEVSELNESSSSSLHGLCRKAPTSESHLGLLLPGSYGVLNSSDSPSLLLAPSSAPATGAVPDRAETSEAPSVPLTVAAAVAAAAAAPSSLMVDMGFRVVRVSNI